MSLSTPLPAPPARSQRWWGLQLFFLLLGLTLLGVLVGRVGVRTLLAQAVGVGWYFVVIVVLFGGAHIFRTLSWRTCLHEPGRHIPFSSLYGLWLAGEAVSLLSFWWSGEVFRTMTTRAVVSGERALSALLVCRAIYAYASLCWVVTGFLLVWVWWVVPLAGVLHSLMLVGTLASAALLLLATATLAARGRAVARLTRWLERRQHRRTHPLRQRLLNFLRGLESVLTALVGSGRSCFLRLLGWNLLAALAGVAEVYLVLRGLGATLTLPQAFVIESLSKLLSVFGYVVPGNLGVREGGMILVLQLFGLAAVTGLNLVLIRRARALVWAAVGGLLLIRHGFSPLVLAPSQGPGRGNSASAPVTPERVAATKVE